MRLILASVLLHEAFTVKSLIGCILIEEGTLAMVFINIMMGYPVSANGKRITTHSFYTTPDA